MLEAMNLKSKQFIQLESDLVDAHNQNKMLTDEVEDYRQGNSIDMGGTGGKNTTNNTNNTNTNANTNDDVSALSKTHHNSVKLKHKLLSSEATARRRLFENFLVCMCQQTVVAEIKIQNKVIVEAKQVSEQSERALMKTRNIYEPLLTSSHLLRPAQSLVLDDCNIDDVDCLTLVSCLKGSKTITELNLVSNRISDAGATALAGFIALPNCKLQFVDVRNNGISLNGIKKLAEALQGNVGRGIEHVYVHNDGRVDAIGNGGVGAGEGEEKKESSLTKIRDAMSSICVIDCRENFPETVAKLNVKIGVPMCTASTLWAKINAELPNADELKMKAIKKKALLQRKKNSEYRNFMVEQIYE